MPFVAYVTDYCEFPHGMAPPPVQTNFTAILKTLKSSVTYGETRSDSFQTNLKLQMPKRVLSERPPRARVSTRLLQLSQGKEEHD